MVTADRYNWREDNAGWAAWSSETADTCVTVTSSSTPNAPMTNPASTMPCRSTFTPSEVKNSALSSESPVRLLQPTNRNDNNAVTAKLMNVPSKATDVGTFTPCARYKAMNAISDEATTATITGLLPSRIDGNKNLTITTRLATSPAIAPNPRQRPRITTAPTNTNARTHIGVARW